MNQSLKVFLFIFLVCTYASAQDNAPANKNKLLEYVFNNKWSFDSIPCNQGGGSYRQFTDKNHSGEILIINGQDSSADPKQKYNFKFEVLSDKKFVYYFKGYAKGNAFIEPIVQDPNTILQDVTAVYELISPDKMVYKQTFKSINLDKLMNKNVISYNTENEEGFSNRCQGSLDAPVLAPVGKTLNCNPNDALSKEVLKQSGNDAFGFGLKFSSTQAQIRIGTKEFNMEYKGDFGKPDARAGSYKAGKAELTYYYNENLALIYENNIVLTAAICK